MNISRLLRSKTGWAALLVIATALERVAAGELALLQGLQLAAPALLVLLLRDAIATLEGHLSGPVRGGKPLPPTDPPAIGETAPARPDPSNAGYPG